MGNKQSKQAAAATTASSATPVADFVPTGEVFYRLSVMVVQARNLPEGDAKSSDSFAVVHVVEAEHDNVSSVAAGLCAKRHRTRVHNSLAPVWNENFEFFFNSKPVAVAFAIFDQDRLSKDKLLCECRHELDDECWDLQAPPSFWTALHVGAAAHVGELQYRITASIEHAADRALSPTSTLGLLELTLRHAELSTAKGKALYVEVGLGTRTWVSRVQSASAETGAVAWNETLRMWVPRHTAGLMLDLNVFRREGAAGPGRPKGELLARTQVPVAGIVDAGPAGRVLDDLNLVKGVRRTDANLRESIADEAVPGAASFGTLCISGIFTSIESLQQSFLENALATFDANQDGVLQRTELLQLLATVHPGLTNEELDELLSTFDQNEDDTIESGEIAAALNSTQFQQHPLASAVLAYIMHGRAETQDMIASAYDNVAPLSASQAAVRAPKTSYATGGVSYEGLFVLDRTTGLIVEEHIPANIRAALKSMYNSTAGRSTVSTARVKSMLQKLSVKEGRKMSTPESALKIPDFIATHQLAMDDFERPLPNQYATFNEFFSRRLRPGARTIAEPDNDRVVVSPADCRMVVFSDVFDATRIWIKGRRFTLNNLLESDELAAAFDGGSLMIARLAPQDYHRWHYAVGGVTAVRSVNRIDGTLYTVSPIAVRREVDVYTENVRIVCVYETSALGLVVMIAVGATVVGSITLDETNAVGGAPVKGNEAGFFQFGGSTVLTLFQRGRVVFDEDLLANTSRGLETLVRMGMRVAAAP